MSFSGEIIFQRIFDLGGTLNMAKARAILRPMAEPKAVQPSRLAPEYVSFAAPIMLNLSHLNLSLESEQGTPMTPSARLYEVGALAILLRMPVRGENVSELARYQASACRMRGESVRRSPTRTWPCVTIRQKSWAISALTPGRHSRRSPHCSTTKTGRSVNMPRTR